MTEREFIIRFSSSLSEEGIKTFPGDFLTADKTREVKLAGKTLLPGEQFFGKFEITTIDGTPVMQANSYIEAKYIVYAGKSKPAFIRVPTDDNEIKFTVTAYEKYLDAIAKRAESDFKKIFPDSKNLNSTVNEIFRILNLIRY